MLLIFPFLSFSQSKDSVIVYRGDGAFENRIIDLSNKNLSKILAISSQVEVLILDNNNIVSLPEWIADLESLRALSIRNNKLSEVDILMYCENLEEIYLSNNNDLLSLPSLTRCKKLRVVDVSATGINDLPVTIRGMEKIGYFKYSLKSTD